MRHYKKKISGFTLVELAIVMIIIGLLITGVLKGQQLITNAQITSQVAQIKAIDTASTSFREQYGDVAGDFTSPTAIIPACMAAPCNVPGDGDQKINNGAGLSVDFSAAPVGEQLGFWAQLNAAQYLTGLNPAVANTFWGGNFPASKISGGGLDVGWYSGSACFPVQQGCTGGGINVRRGTFLTLHGVPNVAMAGTVADAFMTPNQAMRIDTKMDDANPGAGTVQPGGTAACVNAAAYNESVNSASCSLYIQIQN